MAANDPFGLAGQVFDGQFRVDHYIGEGGFSVVYRGTHVGLSEPIAVKCLKLPPALGSAMVESFIKRFRDESRLHYKLSQGHLHIARSIASGTTVAPATSALVPYTVLEWLDGQSLAEELEERRARGLTGRPLTQVVKLLDSAIDALAYAHAQGVVHRDLNPGNLFLAKTSFGMRLKVLDFGVAKVMADSALAMGAAARTFGNMRIFTPSYGAPEQFDERVGAIGPWTDVYAVALLVLEALTDRTVVEGDHIGELAAKALNPTQRPTPRALGISVGDEVEAVLARAVSLAPEERPRDAGELWGMLKHAMAADDGSGRSPHALPQKCASPASTLRMAEALPEGVVGPVVEVARASVTSPSERAHSLSGTLRMSDAPHARAERGIGRNTDAPHARAERGIGRNTDAPHARAERGIGRNTDAPHARAERGIGRNTDAHRMQRPPSGWESPAPEPFEEGDGPADAPPVSVGTRVRARNTRVSVIIALLVVILVIGVVAAAWLLAPHPHAALWGSSTDADSCAKPWGALG